MGDACQLSCWPGRGPRARVAPDRIHLERGTAVRARRYQFHVVITVRVMADHRWPGFGLPAISPLASNQEENPQLAPFLRQGIVVAHRMVLIRDACDHPMVDEVIEATGEDVAGDTQSGPNLIEACDSGQAIADDQERPPVPDDLECLGDRTVHVLEACASHSSRAPLRSLSAPAARAVQIDSVSAGLRVAPDPGLVLRAVIEDH